jgi:hypothetical protein
MSMDREEKAFDFAQDIVKQIVTLSTAIITLTVTFLKDVLPKGTDTGLLELAWFGYLVSIFFGLITLMAMTGRLTDSTGDINGGMIRLLAVMQIGIFFVALGLTLFFGTEVF